MGQRTELLLALVNQGGGRGHRDAPGGGTHPVVEHSGGPATPNHEEPRGHDEATGQSRRRCRLVLAVRDGGDGAVEE